jgi:hypothetical protein
LHVLGPVMVGASCGLHVRFWPHWIPLLVLSIRYGWICSAPGIVVWCFVCKFNRVYLNTTMTSVLSRYLYAALVVVWWLLTHGSESVIGEARVTVFDAALSERSIRDVEWWVTSGSGPAGLKSCQESDIRRIEPASWSSPRLNRGWKQAICFARPQPQSYVVSVCHAAILGWGKFVLCILPAISTKPRSFAQISPWTHRQIVKQELRVARPLPKPFLCEIQLGSFQADQANLNVRNCWCLSDSRFSRICLLTKRGIHLGNRRAMANPENRYYALWISCYADAVTVIIMVEGESRHRHAPISACTSGSFVL